LILLLVPNVAFGAPDSTMSIIPSATAGTTITASDENARNNVVSTIFNSHHHNDIDQTANTLNVGDAAAGNKTITAYNADASKPFMRYDDTADDWLFSVDGVNTTMGLSGQGLTFEGGTADAFETELVIEEPTADRTILFPNASGTVVLAGNTLGATSGGTGQSTYTQGDTLYASATNTLSKLAAGTAGQCLTTGGAGANPAWGGMTTQGDIEYHNGTTRTRLAASTSGYVLKTKGAGQNPAFEAGGFVAWTTGLTQNTTYQAATDLIVTATASSSTGTPALAYLDGLTDASTPPTTRRAYQENTTSGYYFSITFPVRKGDYWRVSSDNMSNYSIQTLSLGS